jgi:hypothetical protein
MLATLRSAEIHDSSDQMLEELGDVTTYSPKCALSSWQGEPIQGVGKHDDIVIQAATPAVTPGIHGPWTSSGWAGIEVATAGKWDGKALHWQTDLHHCITETPFTPSRWQRPSSMAGVWHSAQRTLGKLTVMILECLEGGFSGWCVATELH